MGRAEGFAVSRGDPSSHRVKTADIGVIGLAVMGENLVLNMTGRIVKGRLTEWLSETSAPST